MLIYLFLSVGVIYGQIYHLSLRYSLILLVDTITALVTSHIINSQNHNSKTINCANLFFILLIAFSYSNLRFIYRQIHQLEEPISKLSAVGFLNSPAKLSNGRYQAIFQITKGKFSGENFILSYPESYAIKSGTDYSLNINLYPINKTVNPEAFDYQQYLLAKNISATGVINEFPQKLKPNYSLSSQITKTRINLINYLQVTLHGQKYAGFFIALVTGYQGLIPNEQWDIFRHTGINHIISISGLHITLATTLFVYLISILINYLPQIQTPKQIIIAWCGVFFATIYALLAGFSIPTQRALYMIIVAAYLLANRRYIPLLYQLLISLAIVLIIDPFAIFSIGFWFSYLLVAAIFISIATRTPELSKFKEWLRLQIVITICGIPLSIYYFSSASISSPIANLWAIPVIGNIFTPAVLLSSVLHIPLIIKFVSTMLTYSLIPIEYLSLIPLYWQIKPNLASVILSYCGLVLFMLPFPFKGKNFIAIILIVNILFTIRLHEQIAGTARIHVFSNQSVGFALISTKKHNLLIINHNQPEDISKQFNATVMPYLNSQQIKVFDYIISNQTESNLLDKLHEYKFVINELQIESNINIDGVEFNLFREDNQLALLLKTQNATNYIGNCLAINNPLDVNNLFILMPFKNCNWIIDGNYRNLVINSNYKQQRQMDFIINNLNLNAEKVINLYNNSAINFMSE